MMLAAITVLLARSDQQLWSAVQPGYLLISHQQIKMIAAQRLNTKIHDGIGRTAFP